MSRAGLDVIPHSDLGSAATGEASQFRAARTGAATQGERRNGRKTSADLDARPRRTPRKSLIVVVPDDHVVSPEFVAESLLQTGDHEVVDVIVACAGQLIDLVALRRRVREVRVLFAPSGTSTEDLRELAMRQAPGDIVTLITGAPASPMSYESKMLTF